MAKPKVIKEKIGLVIGKFCPYHNGHKHVIEQAAKECTKVYVIVYDAPGVTDIPLTVRASWITDDHVWSQLYDQGKVQVLAGYGAPQDEGYDHKTKKIQETYVKGLLKAAGVKKVDCFYSSEQYGEHMSKALKAVDRRIDMARVQVPVSGTQVRQNPYKYRGLVPEKVLKDMVTKVLILGAPSTGKSTLTTALAKAYKTSGLPEYGREYWDKHQADHRLTMQDLLNIQKGHKEKFKKAIQKAKGYLFCDTAEITTALFGVYYSGGSLPTFGAMNRFNPYVEDLSQLLANARSSMDDYDIVLLCDTDIPFEDTADRSGPASRPLMQRMTIDLLDSWRIPYHLVRGATVEERVECVKMILSRTTKWKSQLPEEV